MIKRDEGLPEPVHGLGLDIGEALDVGEGMDRLVTLVVAAGGAGGAEVDLGKRSWSSLR